MGGIVFALSFSFINLFFLVPSFIFEPRLPTMDDFFILFFDLAILISSFFVWYRFKHPLDVSIDNEGIILPSNIWLVSKYSRVEFKNIIKAITAHKPNGRYVYFQCKDQFIEFSLNYLDWEDREHFLKKVHESLSILNNSSRLEFSETDTSNFLAKRRATVLILTSLLIMITYSVYGRYFDKQIEYDLLSAISFLPSIILGFLLYKFYYIDRNRIFQLIPMTLFGLYVFFGPVSYLNQIGDNSKPFTKVVSLVKEKDQYGPERNNIGDCFYINDEYIKEDDSQRLCTKQHPGLSETSIVEITYKSGNFNQRWIKSIQIMNAK